jgi:glycosyltransferase involved in cell wall biosynthesis
MTDTTGRTPADSPSMANWIVHLAFRTGLALYLLTLRTARAVRWSRRRVSDTGVEVLLTGTFYSENWVRAHVRPLAQSAQCARVRVVSTFPLPPMDKVEAVYPPFWLTRAIGGVPARLVTFAGLAVWTRPHVVGGFHLLINGLVAALLAPLVGARSMYFCVGGPWEVLEGGIHAENRLFSRLRGPDAIVESQLVRAVGAFDLIITMGTGAARYFRDNGVTAEINIVSGGLHLDARREPCRDSFIDVILVARLAAIKRIDIFLRAVAQVRTMVPQVTAVIVGDGALRPALEELAAELELQDCVTFAGHQRDVGSWLRRARLFVLTSESEGLALSLMEAIAAGLPAVVSAVGDLGDLVQENVNGHLVTDLSPAAFAERIAGLLSDESRLSLFGQAAARRAARYDLRAVVRRWDEILGQGAAAEAKESTGDVHGEQESWQTQPVDPGQSSGSDESR